MTGRVSRHTTASSQATLLQELSYCTCRHLLASRGGDCCRVGGWGWGWGGCHCRCCAGLGSDLAIATGQSSSLLLSLLLFLLSSSLSHSHSHSLSHSHSVCVCVWLCGQYYRWLASVVDLMFFMADFIVRPPIWQFAFLEFSYLLLSSAASIASIPIANVSRTTGQYTRIGTAIHIRFAMTVAVALAVAVAVAVHNHVRIHIRIHIAYSYAYSWRRHISCTHKKK